VFLSKLASLSVFGLIDSQCTW